MLNPFEERCIAAYRNTRDIDAACAQARVHKITMFKILQYNRLLRPEDGTRYGSMGARLGASAELEFSRLVPAAKSMNDMVANNYPGYDFHVHGWRVSVKAFSPLTIKGRISTRARWQAVMVKHESDRQTVDLFCIFLAREKGKLIQDTIYTTYLVPSQLLAGRKSLNKTDRLACELDTFEVAPRKLAAALQEGTGHG